MGRVQLKARVSAVTLNLKKAGGKTLACHIRGSKTWVKLLHKLKPDNCTEREE